MSEGKWKGRRRRRSEKSIGEKQTGGQLYLRASCRCRRHPHVLSITLSCRVVKDVRPPVAAPRRLDYCIASSWAGLVQVGPSRNSASHWEWVSALSDGMGSPCSQTILELLDGDLLVYSNRIGGSISVDTLAVCLFLQVGDGRGVSVGGKEGGRLVGVDAEDVPADVRA
jgi:hypothetical protein